MRLNKILLFSNITARYSDKYCIDILLYMIVYYREIQMVNTI